MPDTTYEDTVRPRGHLTYANGVRAQAETIPRAAHTAVVDQAGGMAESIEKIDLGEVWTTTTGLPFVYAFWAGRLEALNPDEVTAIQTARDAGVAGSDRVAQEYFTDPALHVIGMRYLRENIKYHLGEQELAGLDTFYRYAAELGLVPESVGLRLFDAGRSKGSK